MVFVEHIDADKVPLERSGRKIKFEKTNNTSKLRNCIIFGDAIFM